MTIQKQQRYLITLSQLQILIVNIEDTSVIIERTCFIVFKRPKNNGLQIFL